MPRDFTSIKANKYLPNPKARPHSFLSPRASEWRSFLCHIRPLCSPNQLHNIVPISTNHKQQKSDDLILLKKLEGDKTEHRGKTEYLQHFS